MVSVEVKKRTSPGFNCNLKWAPHVEVKSETYAMIPPIAIMTPRTDLSPMARPDVAQPRATMEHVLTWPTTVLDTGPVWAMMKNWEMLISEAKPPDCTNALYVSRVIHNRGCWGCSLRLGCAILGLSFPCGRPR